MKTKHYRQRRRFCGYDLTGFEEVIQAVSRLNRISNQAAELAENALMESRPFGLSHHLHGHDSIVRYNKQANAVLTRQCYKVHPLKDLIPPAGPQASRFGFNTGCCLFRVGKNRSPIPGLMLASVFKSDLLNVVHKVFAGDEFLEPITQILPDLKHNGECYFYLPGEGIDFWISQDAAEITWHLFENLEYLSLTQEVQVAEQLDLGGVTDLIALTLLTEAFLDCSHLPQHSEAWRLALKGTPLHSIRDHAADLSRENYDGIMLQAAPLLSRFQKALRTSVPQKSGAFEARSYLSVTLTVPCDPPKNIAEELEEINRLAEEAVSEIVTLMAGLPDRQAEKSLSRKRLKTIRPSDFLSSNKHRRLFAARDLSDYWPGFKERYYELGEDEDQPSCPMPLPGTGIPASLRIQAALGAAIVNRYGSKQYDLPEDLFFVPELSDAAKLIIRELNSCLRFRLAFDRLLREKKSGAILESYLAYYEKLYVHWQGGISSISNLIFATAFFHDRLFDHHIRLEENYYRDAWTNVRGTINRIVESYRKQDFIQLSSIIQECTNAVAELCPKYVDRLNRDNDVLDNALRLESLTPFQMPGNMLSTAFGMIEEAGSPFQIRTTGPGSLAAYDNFVRKLEPAIKALRKLRFQRTETVTRRIGRKSSGNRFDPRRLHLVRLGESALLFSRPDIEEHPSMEKLNVEMLLDFSGSMSQDVLLPAKQVVAALAEALNNHCEVRCHRYYSDASFFQLVKIFDTRLKKLAGREMLASLTDTSCRSGIGGNPDAAALLYVEDLIKRDPQAQKSLIFLVSDHFYCSSLLQHIAGGKATEEVAYALKRLTDAGHHVVLIRVGSEGNDPIDQDVPHGYIHFVSGESLNSRADELRKIIEQQIRK